MSENRQSKRNVKKEKDLEEVIKNLEQALDTHQQNLPTNQEDLVSTAHPRLRNSNTNLTRSKAVPDLSLSPQSSRQTSPKKRTLKSAVTKVCTISKPKDGADLPRKHQVSPIIVKSLSPHSTLSKGNTDFQIDRTATPVRVSPKAAPVRESI